MKISSLALALLLGLVGALGATRAFAQEKHAYRVSGTFVEGCSCSAPCPCQITGLAHGCQGVGAMSLAAGSYVGVDLTGVKIAYATVPGDWIRLYLDVPNQSQREAAVAFARAVYGPFGKIEAVKDARIDLAGQAGKYVVNVDGGKIMMLNTEPVLGGDGQTPVRINNIQDPLHPNVMLGKTISCTYRDGDRSFTVKDGNSYSTDRMRSRGKL